MPLLTLPHDILILILQNISVRELAALARTCGSTRALVIHFGWAGYLRVNPRPSFSLWRARTRWSSETRVRYDVLTDYSWSHSEFVARPLARPWPSKMQPILAISTSRLVVAAGSDIYSYKFSDIIDGVSPPMHPEGTYSFPVRQGRLKDITGMTFIADSELDQTLYVGLQDGTLQHVNLGLSPHDTTGTSLNKTYSHFSRLREGDFIESLTSEKNMMLSLSSAGCAMLVDLYVPDCSPGSVQLNARGWVSHLCMDSSGPYAAFGTSSLNPLRVHSITNDQLSPTPSAILHTNISYERPSSSAVYGISRAPPASPWGASPQVLVSGWFDGQVRCYDLRSSSRRVAAVNSHSTPAPLRPVLSLYDPLQLESIYSVSCGGGSASHIAAGSARHSVVSFWDVRSPRTGWSVHAPGNDPSPVYSVILESSRLYGATQSRPFVYDFGPGVSVSTYPSLPHGRGIDGLKRRKGSGDVGYYVTKYPHMTRRSSINES